MTKTAHSFWRSMIGDDQRMAAEAEHKALAKAICASGCKTSFAPQ